MHRECVIIQTKFTSSLILVQAPLIKIIRAYAFTSSPALSKRSVSVELRIRLWPQTQTLFLNRLKDLVDHKGEEADSQQENDTQEYGKTFSIFPKLDSEDCV